MFHTIFMDRLQQINGDTVLEITEQVTRRISEKSLLRQKEQLEQSVQAFQRRLAEVNADLEKITNAKNEKAPAK